MAKLRGVPEKSKASRFSLCGSSPALVRRPILGQALTILTEPVGLLPYLVHELFQAVLDRKTAKIGPKGWPIVDVPEPAQSALVHRTKLFGDERLLVNLGRQP